MPVRVQSFHESQELSKLSTSVLSSEHVRQQQAWNLEKREREERRSVLQERIERNKAEMNRRIGAPTLHEDAAAASRIPGGA